MVWFCNWFLSVVATWTHVACSVQEDIQDTTGAGDAFLGTLLYGTANNMPHHDMMKLAAVVAASKCTALGARPGLPFAKDINQALLPKVTASITKESNCL